MAMVNVTPIAALRESFIFAVPAEVRSLPVEAGGWELGFFEVRDRIPLTGRGREIRVTLAEYRKGADRVWLEYTVPTDPTGRRSYYMTVEINGKVEPLLASQNLPVEQLVCYLTGTPYVVEATFSQAALDTLRVKIEADGWRATSGYYAGHIALRNQSKSYLTLFNAHDAKATGGLFADILVRAEVVDGHIEFVGYSNTPIRLEGCTIARDRDLGIVTAATLEHVRMLNKRKKR